MLVGRMQPATATGTSLGALLLPVGALGAWQYYKNGHLDVRASLMIALGDVIPKWPLVRWVLYCPADPHDFAHGGRMTCGFRVGNGWKADIRSLTKSVEL